MEWLCAGCLNEDVIVPAETMVEGTAVCREHTVALLLQSRTARDLGRTHRPERLDMPGPPDQPGQPAQPGQPQRGF